MAHYFEWSYYIDLKHTNTILAQARMSFLLQSAD